MVTSSCFHYPPKRRLEDPDVSYEHRVHRVLIYHDVLLKDTPEEKSVQHIATESVSLFSKQL